MHRRERPERVRVRKVRPRTGKVLLTTGVFLVVFSIVWVSVDAGVVLLRNTVGGEDGGSAGMGGGGPGGMAGGGEEDMNFMSGEVAFINFSLFENASSFLSLTPADFVMEWHNVSINSTGVYDTDTGEALDFPEESIGGKGDGGEPNGTGDEGEATRDGEGGGGFSWFPLFGVEKKDYTLYDATLGKEVRANYSGETEVMGERAYFYTVFENNRTHDPVSGMGVEMKYYAGYFVHPTTSLPLAIDMKMSFLLFFPDFYLLQPEGESRYNYTGTVWVQNETVPGKYDLTNVREEVVSRSYLSEDCSMVLFEEKVTYYDIDTGEPLPPDQQPPPEFYAVNRTTFRYVTGYNGTARSGYYTFPIGRLEKKDYPMWDSLAGEENVARYEGEDSFANATVWVYHMHTDNATVEGGNPFLPVYRHPGTEYTYTMDLRFYVDPGSSIPLNVVMNGTVYMRSTVPGSEGIPVSYINFSFDASAVENMSRIARLFREVLLPFSKAWVPVFYMHIQTTGDFSALMLDLAHLLEKVLFFMRVVVPVTAGVLGGVFLFFGLRRRRRYLDSLWRNMWVSGGDGKNRC